MPPKQHRGSKPSNGLSRLHGLPCLSLFWKGLKAGVHQSSKTGGYIDRVHAVGRDCGENGGVVKSFEEAELFEPQLFGHADKKIIHDSLGVKRRISSGALY